MFRRILLAAFGAILAVSAQAATLTVTSTADGPSTIDGKCTLHEAISSINGGSPVNPDCPNSGAAYGTSDTIGFNIPAATDPGCNAVTGVCTIAPTLLNSLSVTRTVLIDGYTQPGATPNTLAGGAYPNAHGLNMHIKIELSGNSLPAGTGNLNFSSTASTSEVRGLAIYGFQGDCLSVGGSSNLVDGNIIGLRADGSTVAMGIQCTTGIAMGNGQGNNVVGGFTPASRNLIATNTGPGILVAYSNSDVIANNLIGTDITGTQGRSYSFSANTANGIEVYSSSGVLYTVVDSNVIADYGGAGIYLGGASHSNIVRNAIGIGVGGVTLGNALAGGSAGVVITNSPLLSTNNTAYLNGIAYNSGDGILVQSDANGDPHDNQLDRNAIFANGGLGINLQPVGEAANTPTANDAPANLDADSGPNHLQNFPVITSATINSSGGVDIAYTFDSGAGAIYSISAYATDTCNWTGYGEGRYLGGPPLSWATDAGGHLAQTFVYTPMPANWAAGKWVSLLATDSNGSTSEFSPCVQIAAAPAPVASGAPNPLNLGSSTVGTPGIPQTETVTNSGNATLNISTVTVTGANAADFGITANTCTGASLAPSATCTITLRCTPAATGARAANLNIASNDAASPLVVALSATGFPPPTASPSANPLAFGNQTVATTSATQTETITNLGVAHLNISAVSVGGTNAADFAITANSCTGASLAPSATCAIGVTFTPGGTGARAATLNFASNDPASPLVVNLSGTGVAGATGTLTPVPTLGESALFLLTALLGVLGVNSRRRRLE